MNRPLTYLLGPEAALTLATIVLYLFCARHNSGEGRDVAIMEKIVWMLPFLLAPFAFATILAPDAKNWWWLGRAILFTYVATFVCGFRVIDGFGSGSKGQDVAIILLVMTGSVAIGISTAITGSMILAATKPGFANWFHAHQILGSFLVALSVIPIAFVLGAITTFVGTILLVFYCEVLKR